MNAPPLFQSLYEIHITVSASSDDVAFRAACGELGVKCISIDLAIGNTRRQPMTSSFVRGTFDTARGTAATIAEKLSQRGFDVVRTKIEQHGRLENAPATDADALLVPLSYFEFHAKLAMPSDGDIDAISATIASAGAHLSRNAMNVTGERFVTLRAYRLGRANADLRFQSLLDVISKLEIPVRNRVREFTVYDSNPSIDHGWITSP